MTSMWWTFSLQPNQTRFWEDDVIGHAWGIGHVCESYIFIIEDMSHNIFITEDMSSNLFIIEDMSHNTFIIEDMSHNIFIVEG